MAPTNVMGGDRKVATAAAFLEAAGGRPCDGCHSSPAVLHCPADAAFLCSHCDARVHGANGLASRHERAWLCEVCEHSTAIVTCKADAAALCASCDVDIHSVNILARRHERVPLLPFSGPSPKHPHANVFAPVAGPCHAIEKEEDKEEEAESVMKSEAQSWLLPPAEDPLELRAATTDFFFSGEDESLLDLACVPRMEGIRMVDEPDSFFKLDISGRKADAEHSYCHSLSSSEAAVVPDISQKTGTRRPVDQAAPATTTRTDRKAKVMKYREKRKKRRFEKTIRYASRKAYAEVRPRIKGRFAKRTEAEEAVPVPTYSSAVAAFLGDDDFCVPTFYP